mmetsp:Transcript_1262/g.2687  ORF Transcript_1262/g.2687 Transcript_1262/m.2687 type:complete len:205 (-) Transcript_1262:32-646(-)
MPSADFCTSILVVALFVKNSYGYTVPLSRDQAGVSQYHEPDSGSRPKYPSHYCMDSLAIPASTLEGRKKKSKKRVHPNVELVESAQEHTRNVSVEKDRITVTRFYAPWCKACKAAEPSFLKLVKDMSPRVKFVEVLLEDEAEWEGLGVPSVPFAHIYHPDVGLVEEMKFHRSDVSGVKKILGDYLEGSCELLTKLFDDEDLDFQ